MQSSKISDFNFVLKNSILKFIFCVSLFSLFSCSSNRVKKIDDKLDTNPKGTTQGGGVIGIKDGQVVIQEEASADDELRVQQWKNWDLEVKINEEKHWLHRCQQDVADPRLGGNGKIIESPEISGLQSPSTIKEQIGISDDGDIKFVKREP